MDEARPHASRIESQSFHPPIGVLRFVIAGMVVIASLFAGIGIWSARTNIAGAVIAPATVVVDSNVKKVQHLNGGIVRAIYVRNGDRVVAGETLIALDDTQIGANLQIVTNQIDETSARLARLNAEQSNAEAVTYPSALAARSNEPAIHQIIESENALFMSRSVSLGGQTRQLRERILQLENEINGLIAQLASKSVEIDLISNELTSLAELERKRLVPASKMLALRCVKQRVLRVNMARSNPASRKPKGASRRLNLASFNACTISKRTSQQKFTKRKHEWPNSTSAALPERICFGASISLLPLAEPFINLPFIPLEAWWRLASQSCWIVPDNDMLMLEARIAPRDRENIRLGASAKIRFSAFDQRSTPEIDGTVKLIAARPTDDARSGQAYYSVRIAISDDELKTLNGQTLVPGLPADADAPRSAPHSRISSSLSRTSSQKHSGNARSCSCFVEPCSRSSPLFGACFSR